MNLNEHRNTFLLTIAAAFLAHGAVTYVSGIQAAATTPISAPETPCVKETITTLPSTPSSPTTVTVTKTSSHKLSNKAHTIDLAFCIDTTSSMSAEIDTVKATVKSMVEKLRHGQQNPNVRVALVAYRDKDDDYVTKVFPFSSNVDQFVKDISELSANGGGDGPESVDKGIHAALNELEWSSNKKTARLLYVIGDAPPHFSKDDYNLQDEAKSASAKGISINTIGCGDLLSYGNDGIESFKKLALMTNGKYESLTYEQEIADASGHKTRYITAGSKTYEVKSDCKEDWTKGADALIASGNAVECTSAPMLQGATNGTIGPMGADATVIMGVNTAGTVRVNNLDSLMLHEAQEAFSKILK